jgi:hypothetical protein
MIEVKVESRISKILSEPTMLHDDNFHIVSDIDPIIPGHVLCVAKTPVAGMLDIGATSIKKLLENLERSALFPNGVAFIERGRAPFCTSLNGPHRGHGHFFPLEHLVENWQEALFEDVGGFVAGDLSEFDAEAGLSGEYLLFGSTRSGFVYRRNVVLPEKRFIRRRIATLHSNSSRPLKKPA